MPMVACTMTELASSVAKRRQSMSGVSARTGDFCSMSLALAFRFAGFAGRARSLDGLSAVAARAKRIRHSGAKGRYEKLQQPPPFPPRHSAGKDARERADAGVRVGAVALYGANAYT